MQEWSRHKATQGNTRQPCVSRLLPDMKGKRVMGQAYHYPVTQQQGVESKVIERGAVQGFRCKRAKLNRNLRAK